MSTGADQYVNAQHVVNKGFGLSLDPATCNAAQVLLCECACHMCTDLHHHTAYALMHLTHQMSAHIDTYISTHDCHIISMVANDWQ